MWLYCFKNKTIVLPVGKDQMVEYDKNYYTWFKWKQSLMRVSTCMHIMDMYSCKFKVNQWKQLMLANENYYGFSSIFSEKLN